MFDNTKPFTEKTDAKGDFKIRVGSTVPPSAVNLAHFYSPPLDSRENVIIGDNASSIMENVQQPSESIMYADTDGLLKHTNTNLSDAVVPSELVMITDKFEGREPLFYKYTLDYLHMDQAPNMDGTYYGDSIEVLDANGKELISSYKYKIVLTSYAPGIRQLRRVYKVDIYTSFQIENNYQVKCNYNAVKINDTGKGEIPQVTTFPAHSEVLSPNEYYRPAKTILEALTQEDRYYMQKSSDSIKSSVIYTKGAFKDPRNPHRIMVDVDVEYEDGTSETLNLRGDSGGYIEVLNFDSTIERERDRFVYDRQIISNDTVSNMVSSVKKIVSVKPSIVNCDRLPESIEVYSNPDGSGEVLARTTLDTGKITNIPDLFFKVKDNHILTGYAVKYKDRLPIRVLNPREKGVNQAWSIRVQNGRFKIEEGNKVYHYYLPEYDAQVYDEFYGKPYRKVVDERPKLIGPKSVRVSKSPLHVVIGCDNKPLNLDVYRLDSYMNKWSINITNWNSKDGIINIEDVVSENDNIYVDYVYEEQSYTYRGFLGNLIGIEDHHILLDCNPNKSHRMTMVDDEGGLYDTSTFSLIDKTVYVYIKPAIEEVKGGGRVINDQVLFHSFEQLSKEKMDADKLLLIGEVYVRPNSSIYGLRFTDTRSRGGGLIEDISTQLRRELEPESDFYWDIGYWDGEPYPENAVIVIRIDKRVLKEHGGKLEQDEVETKVKKHLAFGTLPLIEYVSTYDDDRFNINHLKIDIQRSNRIDFKPEFFISRTSNYKPTIVRLLTKESRLKFRPGIVNLTAGHKWWDYNPEWWDMFVNLGEISFFKLEPTPHLKHVPQIMLEELHERTLYKHYKPVVLDLEQIEERGDE